jgi:hypothetical protein
MYINTQTGAYPLSETQIKAEFPNTSFPSPFTAPPPYAWVFPSPAPTHDPITQGVRQIAPTQVNGKWQQAWEVYDLDAETIAANQQAWALKVKDEIIFNTQKRLDDFAKTRLYDGILSACTYATSSVPKFQTEGQYCVDARDNTWATLYTILAEVEAGTRPMPTGFDDVSGDLPVLTWPT